MNKDKKGQKNANSFMNLFPNLEWMFLLWKSTEDQEYWAMPSKKVAGGLDGVLKVIHSWLFKDYSQLYTVEPSLKKKKL